MHNIGETLVLNQIDLWQVASRLLRKLSWLIGRFLVAIIVQLDTSFSEGVDD